MLKIIDFTNDLFIRKGTFCNFNKLNHLPEPQPKIVSMVASEVTEGENLYVTCVVQDWDGFVSNNIEIYSLIVLDKCTLDLLGEEN